MKLARRTFLKVAGVTAAGLVPARADAAAAVPARDAMGVLVDTTRCIGCRGCEGACAEVNGLPSVEPPPEVDVFARWRDKGPDAFTVVNRAPMKGRDGAERYAKTQCLHCVDPGCAAACPVRALEKTAKGPVTYHADRCMGCRYCMVSCPFGVPKYQYEAAIPYVRKCTFCADRQAKGQPPACTEACPAEALLFGKREELLEVAKTRIYQEPDKYVHRVYGEREAGGTSWLYITDVPFESLGLPAVAEEPYPGFARSALSAVPFVMTLWPPVLMGLYAAAKGRAEGGEDEHA
jgi:Fe-S-cluster-containing dehydrogenase component